MHKLLLAAVALVTASGLARADYQSRDFKQESQDAKAYQTRAFRPVPLVGDSQGYTVFALGFLPKASLPGRAYDVRGFRLNLLAGTHRSLVGLDLGVIGNGVDGSADGLQIAGFYNAIGLSDGSFQVAGFLNKSRQDFTGVQVGCLNFADEEMNGLQVGLGNVNCSLNGLQIGAFNKSYEGGGVQIGVVNAASRLSGVQIGLVNYNADSLVPLTLLLNMAF